MEGKPGIHEVRTTNVTGPLGPGERPDERLILLDHHFARIKDAASDLGPFGMLTWDSLKKIEEHTARIRELLPPEEQMRIHEAEE